MDPVRPSVSVELIEALAALRPVKRGSGSKTEGAATEKPSTHVREQLRQIVLGMQANDVASYRETRSRLLQCILGSQWGENVGSDPLYADVVAAVERDIAENPQLDAMFRDAMDGLRRTPRT